MFAHNEYQGTVCPFPVISYSLEAMAPSNNRIVGGFIPPLQYNSSRIGTTQPRLMRFPSIPHLIRPLLVLLYCDRHLLITPVEIGTTQFHFILYTPPAVSTLCCLWWDLLNRQQCCLGWIVAHIFHFTLLTSPSFWHSITRFALPNPHRCFIVWNRAPLFYSSLITHTVSTVLRVGLAMGPGNPPVVLIRTA